MEFEVNEDVRPESNPVVEDPKESVDPTGTLATSSTALLLFLIFSELLNCCYFYIFVPVMVKSMSNLEKFRNIIKLIWR